MSSATCSYIKLDYIQKWSQLLLTWINKCITNETVKTLNVQNLRDTIEKYKDDLYHKAMGDRNSFEDVETLLNNIYPGLELRNFNNDEDYSRKIYIMTSAILFHLCVNSKDGLLEKDICNHLQVSQQDMILRFCEILNEVDVTYENIERAIADAIDTTAKLKIYSKHTEPTNDTIFGSNESTKYTPSSKDITKAPWVKPRASNVSDIALATSEVLKLTYFESFQNVLGLEIKDYRQSGQKSSVVGAPDVSPCESDCKCMENKLSDGNFEHKTSMGPTQHTIAPEPDIEMEDKNILERARDLLYGYLNSRRCTREICERKDDQKKIPSEDQEDLPPSRSGVSHPSAGITPRRGGKDPYPGGKGVPPPKSTGITPQSSTKDPYTGGTGTSPTRSRDPQCSGKDPYQDGKGRSPPRSREICPKESTKVPCSERKGVSPPRCKETTPQGSCGVCPKGKVSSKKSAGIKIKTSGRKSPSGGKGLSPPRSAGDLPPSHGPSECRSKCGVPNERDVEDTPSRAGVSPKRGKEEKPKKSSKKKRNICIAVTFVLLAIAAIAGFLTYYFLKIGISANKLRAVELWGLSKRRHDSDQQIWQCVQGVLCEAISEFDRNFYVDVYPSLSRCQLLCSDPLLWPQPTGQTHYSKKLVALTTKNLEYKFISSLAENVQSHLSEAFKEFLNDLNKMESNAEKTGYKDLNVNNVNINIDITSDPEHNIQLSTDESYILKVNSENNQVTIRVIASSFCGARHGLETLRQLILMDLFTGNLITLTEIDIQDVPFYKLRGLMIATTKFIPLNDLKRTLDAMAMSKLNTFHWRIPLASFRFIIPTLSELYDTLVYTKQYVESLVRKADTLGIRVIIEVASGSEPAGANVTMKINDCDDILKTESQTYVSNLLSVIYEDTLHMTKVKDIIHLSSIFSSSSCVEKVLRHRLLHEVLDRLKRVNYGTFPRLPIIWHRKEFEEEFDIDSYEQYLALQVTQWLDEPSIAFLNNFQVIFSIGWDLSCEMMDGSCYKIRDWQDMYTTQTWPEGVNIVGGEALLWTDMMKDENLDEHIWPRTAAVAERLWSYLKSPDLTDSVYQRLEAHRYEDSLARWLKT